MQAEVKLDAFLSWTKYYKVIRGVAGLQEEFIVEMGTAKE